MCKSIVEVIKEDHHCLVDAHRHLLTHVALRNGTLDVGVLDEDELEEFSIENEQGKDQTEGEKQAERTVETGEEDLALQLEVGFEQIEDDYLEKGNHQGNHEEVDHVEDSLGSAFDQDVFMVVFSEDFVLEKER